MSVNGFKFNNTVHKYNYGSLENIPENFAPEYVNNTAYSVGDYCTHNHILYRCTTQIAGETWNASHWTSVDIAVELKNEVSDLSSAIEEIEPGLSSDAKVALLACFENVAWGDGDGRYYIDTLRDALYIDSPYIGTLTFPIVKESSPIIGSNVYDAEQDKINRVYSLVGSPINRIAGDFSQFDFHVGDVITLDDSETYAFAIGTSTNGNDDWIGGGYISSYPFTVTSENISKMKKILIKRNDNATISQEDMDYVNAHINLERVINKSLDRITVAYDNQTVYLEYDNPVPIRPHLTVTAYYSDGTNEVTSLYRLRVNTIVPGSNSITVYYGGKIAVATINAVILDYFLRSITPDNGLGYWGYSGETPEDNSGYGIERPTDIDKVSFNISNILFSAGTVLHFEFRYMVKYAIGTNRQNTSYNNRTWISGGYLASDTYTLLSEDVSDMKVLYVRALESTTNIQTGNRKRIIISSVYREVRS